MHYTDSLLYDLKHHPRVCSNCFRYLKTEDLIPEWVRRRKGPITADAITDVWTPTRWTFKDSPPGESASERRPTRVCECGAFSAYAELHRDSALAKSTLVAFAGNLSDTLAELQRECEKRGALARSARFSHDRAELYRCVRHLKAQPQHQFKDDLILAVSLELARDNE